MVTNMSAGVRKVAVGALAPDINNSLVIGVIISKQSYRSFTSRKDGEERGVWNFTLRDSPTDTINITFWGTADGAKRSFESFSIGDVVQVINPRILFRHPGNSDAAYSPVVSSPFQLQLHENNSLLLLYDEEDAECIRNLMLIPTKPNGDFLRLSDLLAYGQAMRGHYVNILVAVRNVGELRTVKSKRDSRDLKCRDILVMDQTHLEFQITLWSEDDIKRANCWRSRQTVLFFADIRIDWNDFKQSVTAIITSRTVITENPSNAESRALGEYAESFPLEPIAVLSHLSKSIINPQLINTVMTTAQIMDKAYNNNVLDNKFTALLYATITALDLDGPESPVTYKCPTCSQFLDEMGKCFNADCLLAVRNKCVNPIPFYNLKVNLTDHRGSLYDCRLMSPAADEVLECPVQRYLTLSSTAKTNLKWQFLLSRCELCLLVLCISPERSHPLISLLKCRKANLTDVSSKLPIY